MHEDTHHASSNKFLLAFIAVVIVGYAAAGTTCLLPGHGGATPIRAFEESDSQHPETGPEHPPFWMVIPFAALLLAIAVFPLVPKVSVWWESNLHKFYVSALLGVGTLLFYLLV